MADDIWAGAEIEQTLGEIGLSAGVDANLPLEVRFARRVRELVEAAIVRHGSLSAPCAFVFSPGGEDSRPAEAEFHPRVHTGEVDPAGGVWLLGAAARSGFRIPLDSPTTAEIFEICEHLGLADCPTAFCDTGAVPPRFAWYPSGIVAPDDVFEGPLAPPSAPTLDDLLEVVERVHRTRLLTRHNQNTDTTLWQEPGSYWVHIRAEKRVQDALMAGIGGAFGAPYFVEEEKTGDSGRFDIGFREFVGGGTSTLRAILELKVARSKGSNGATESANKVEAHLVSGVEQAYAYADENEVSDAACLVFDLRKVASQVEPPAARQRADQLQVRLRYWRCFPTAEDYRTFAVPPPPS